VATINLQSPRLRKLAKALSPAYLRVGGSEADDAVFDLDGACSKSRGGSGIPDAAFCLKVDRWEELIAFTEDTGLDLVFDVNVMYGRNCTTRCSPQPCTAGNTGYGTCSPWDPSNAFALLEFTAAKGLKVAGFEVGNEKEHVLTPQDYADCLVQMRQKIDALWPEPAERPLLIGPDENPRGDWLRQMLTQGGSAVDVVTYHLYAGYGLDPSLSQEILDPGFLDFTKVIAGVAQRAQQQAAPHAQLWVGETAAAWHDGEAGITDAFESGFWFVDQLGTVASMSHQVMLRQAFVGGNYSMLGVNDGFIPRPDYYTGVLFKRLMGSTVLTSYQTEPAVMPYLPAIRGYLHCTPDSPNAVTLAYINVDSNRSFELQLQGTSTEGVGMNVSVRDEYVLTSGGMGPPGPHQSELSSLHMKLNGKLLELGDSDDLPEMPGKHVTGGNFVAPPRSYGFVVYPQAGAPACQEAQTDSEAIRLLV
jgi:heparanase 1